MRSKALPGWAHTLCTAAAALVFLLAYELIVYRVPVTEIFLPVSSWSDEVIYSKQLAAAVQYGAPQGYFGFNESHAAVGTYAAWGPAVFLVYALPGLLLRGQNAFLWCNLLFVVLGWTFFARAARLGWKRQLAFAAALAAMNAPIRYVFSAMQEPLHYALMLAVLGCGILARRDKSRAAWAGLCVLCAVATLVRPYEAVLWLFPLALCRQDCRRIAVCVAGGAVSLGGTLVLMSKFYAPYFFTNVDVSPLQELGRGQVVSAVRDVAHKLLDALRTVAEMLADPKVQIQYASKYASSSNYWKNAIGMNRGIDKLDVIGEKQKEEEALRQWSRANNHPEYIAALDSIEAVMKELSSVNYAYYQLLEGIAIAVEFSQVPPTGALIKALKEKNQPRVDSLMTILKENYGKFADKNYNRKVDRRVAKAMLKAYRDAVPEGERLAIFDLIDKKFKGDIDRYVDAAFEKSVFAGDANFEKFCKKPSAKALENDLMVALRNAYIEKSIELSGKRKPLNDRLTRAKKIYIKGLLDMAGDAPTYPDANFTIRMTYGNVLPYSPADGVDYRYYTTQRGILEKEDPDNWEFVVPSKLKELIINKDFGEYAMENGDLPCCFLSNNDITGGNSGSPVINANGELIGAAFDGNWEAMSGDIVFEKDLQRCINVDIRYVLFIIDKYAGAKNLIDEMTIIR